MKRISTNSKSYRNARNWHWDNFINLRPDTIIDVQNELVEPFDQWLAEQGAVIDRSRKPGGVGVDNYDVAIGIDWIEFENDADATVFLLKWT